MLENHQKTLSLNQQHSFLKTKQLEQWSHYLLSSIILRSIINSSLWLVHLWKISLKVIKVFILMSLQIQSSRILKYLRIDFIQKHHHSLSHSQTFNESLKASTLWDIKNVKQLQHWVKQDSEVFLEDLNSLQTQRDLNVKACELFDKISNEQIWKTHFEKMN